MKAATARSAGPQLSLWWAWGAIAAALSVHVLVYIITAHTNYAICLSKLNVYGPAERDRITQRFVSEMGLTNPADCCQFSKDAGEFRLGYNNYVNSGAIWVVRTKREAPARPRMLGFFTNCGAALSEQDYFARFVI